MNTSSSRSHTQPPTFIGVSTSGDQLWPLFPRNDSCSASLVTGGQDLALDPPAPPPPTPVPFQPLCHFALPPSIVRHTHRAFPRSVSAPSHNSSGFFPLTVPPSSATCDTVSALLIQPSALSSSRLPHRLLPSCAPTPSAHPGSPGRHPQVLPQTALSPSQMPPPVSTLLSQ